MKLPIITSRRDIEVRIVGGQSVLELFQQVRNVLLRELPEVAFLFAEPIVNPIRDEIAWATRLVGEVRAVEDLSSEEFTKTIGRLESTFASLNGLIERLSAGGTSCGGGASILKAMMVTPSLAESLFLVGDDLVLTQWGCYKFGSPESSADIFKEIFSLMPSQVGFEGEPDLTSHPAEVLQKPVPTSSHQQSSPSLSPSAPLDQGVQREAELDFQINSTGEPQHANEKFSPANFWPFLWGLLIVLLLILVTGIFLIVLNEFDRQQAERLASEISASEVKVLERASECRELGVGVAREGSGVSSLELWSRRYEAGAPDAVGDHTNVSLAWNSIADLDLIVQQPDGQTVYFGKVCRGGSCGLLDVDANRCARPRSCQDLTTRPLENISWSGPMLPGSYVISVMLYDIHPAHTLNFPIEFTVEVLRQGRRETKIGSIEKADVRCGERCTAIASQFQTFLVE